MSRLSPQEEIILLRKKARRRLVGAIALVAIAIAVLWNTLGRTPQQVHPEQIAIVPESASSALAQPAAPTGQPPLTMQEPERHQSSEPANTVISQPAEPPAPVTQTAPRNASASATATVPDDAAARAKAEQEKAKQEKAAKEKKEKEEKRLAEEKAKKEKEKAAAQAPERQPKPTTTEPPPKPKKQEPDPAAILDGRADAGGKTGTQAKQTADSTPSKKVMIQLAALTDQNKIDTMKNKLSQLGLNASYSKVQTSKGEATRVRVGPFANRAEADATMNKLSRAGLSGIVLP